MKLNPKIATFCPGCNHKKLELNTSPQLIIKPEKKETTKKITLLGDKKKKSKGGLF